MNKEFIRLIHEIIQDTRYDATINDRYKCLIKMLFDNLELSWNKEELTLRNDRPINYLKTIEPELYAAKLKYAKEEYEKALKAKEEIKI